MSSPSHAEILKGLTERLRGDAKLMAAASDRVFNHIPQDAALPLIRFRWEQAGEWDTKDSAGFMGSCIVDVWTDHRGDKLAFELLDMIDALLHLQPLTLASSQSLLMRHDRMDRFTEPDGLTHHAVLRFTHVATT